jgi:hypothetical protein
MNPAELLIDEKPEGAVFPVKVLAGSGRKGLRDVQAGALRVAVQAPREKGKANKALLALLAEVLGVRKSALAIVSGSLSPDKRIAVTGMSAAELRSALVKQA